MPPEKKKKRDLIATFQRIERFHRRRSELVIHAALSLAFQAAMWLNWYASYAAVDRGFEGTFFTDRFSISLGLLLALMAHFILVYLAESKDRLVVLALRRHEQDLEDGEVDDEPFDEQASDTAADDSASDLWAAHESPAADRQRR